MFKAAEADSSKPTSANASAVAAASASGSAIEHCMACKANSADIPFAFVLGWPGSSRCQCWKCYWVWCPLAKLLSAPESVARCATAASFHEKGVRLEGQAANRLFDFAESRWACCGARGSGHTELRSASQYFRSGQVLRKRDRTFQNQSFRATQVWASSNTIACRKGNSRLSAILSRFPTALWSARCHASWMCGARQS